MPGVARARARRDRGLSAPKELLRAVAIALGSEPQQVRALSGGSINGAWRVDFASGERAFLKSRRDAPAAEFAAEAAGLSWLAEADALRLPRVLGLGADRGWLALEWISANGLPDPERLGRGLAHLHRAGAPKHGSLPPRAPDRLLRLGEVALPNHRAAAWPEFYAESRLRPLVRIARERGSISSADARAIEAVCERIEMLCGPPEPPARLHGDLWLGNVLADADGNPWLIDPAAYGGHREIDLAMLRLFGSPGERAFAAYAETYPLADGYRERIELWQLLPLLVHAALFGASYGAAAGAAARRYL